MLKIFINYSVLILLFFLAGCDYHEHAAKAKEAKKAKVDILQNMKPVEGLLTNTTYAGTVDHPTINGGIISAANGITVSHDAPIETNQSVAVKINDTYHANLAIPQKPFVDNWATSQKVKRLLEEAAKSGKLGYVLKKSDAMGLPASVATVPIVESGYRDNALSAKGAVGAWQLMPGTANDYGLKNAERNQFAPSTVAALNLLNKLHQQFGSWELAFAAYNAGAARVQSALLKNPKVTTVQELDLPQETKAYVARLMKVNQIIAQTN